MLQLGLGTPSFALQDGSPTWNAAVSPALTMWNQQMQRVHFTGVVNPSAPVSSGDGVNSVVFSSTIFGQSFGEGTLAITYYRSQGGSLIEADVLFNAALTFNSYRGPLQFGSYYVLGDIRRVFLHELGHALGLNHPDSAGQQVAAVMNSTVGDRETLAPDDISGVQWLYGPPVALLPPSTSLLWQNNATGERQIWSMNGTIHTATSSLGLVSREWNMATSADFNGDGKVDIVWQNSVTGQRAIWLMNGTTFASSVSLPSASISWEIVAAADFNGDGKPDLVWQNSATGALTVWLMNHTTFISSVSIGRALAGWKIKSAADFNGDGKADLLLQNNSNGRRAVWFMNRVNYASSAYLPTATIDWNIVGTGDFNADGKRDILWQSQSTGARSIWLMNGINRTGNASLGTVATPWNIRNY
ncbi:MAG: FG-GAP-like repeat-containing protein [Verrucomicrobiota bacterium]